MTPISYRLQRSDFTIGGNLRSHSIVGGYPLLYLDEHSAALCPACAQNDYECGNPYLTPVANWENPDLYCDQCSKRIESAYAEEEFSD